MEIKNPMLKNVSLFKRSRKTVALLLLLLAATGAQAQTDRQLVRQGNKQFRLGNAAEAEVSYRKAVEKNQRNPQANYNLGNALMQQRKDSLAITQYEKAAKLETNPLRRAQAYHNMGVICQQHQMFSEAIEAYKEALRNNPTDDQTRYNLALCKRQQQNQQQNQNQQNQDQQKQQQDQQQKQDQQKPQPDRQQMSKENAEQLLNAAMQEEKQTQERMKKAQQQPQRRQLQKNW